MSRRAVQWISGLAALDVLVLALTVHEALTWHAGKGSPSVMPLSEMLGWTVALIVTVLLAVVVKESRRS